MAGNNQIQVPSELLEGQNELEAQVFVVEDIEEGIVVAQVVEAVVLQQLHDGGIWLS